MIQIKAQMQATYAIWKIIALVKVFKISEINMNKVLC